MLVVYGNPLFHASSDFVSHANTHGINLQRAVQATAHLVSTYAEFYTSRPSLMVFLVQSLHSHPLNFCVDMLLGALLMIAARS